MIGDTWYMLGTACPPSFIASLPCPCRIALFFLRCEKTPTALRASRAAAPTAATPILTFFLLLDIQLRNPHFFICLRGNLEWLDLLFLVLPREVLPLAETSGDWVSAFEG